MRYRIEELAEIIDGDRGANYPKQDEFLEDGFCLFLNTGNVTKNGFCFDKNSFITKEKDSSLRKGKLLRGDIVYTTRGTVGNVAIYSDSVVYDTIRINSGMVILRVNNKVDSRFLYQMLRSEFCRSYFLRFCTGSAQPQLPISILKTIEIDIPEYDCQQRIADILSAYDDLIENNNRQIKLLEEAAQRLYKEWFVDLRFPGHETTKIVDGVPEGWTIQRLGCIADIIMGQSPKSEFYNQTHDGLPFHQGVGSYGYRFPIDNVYTTSYPKIAEGNSILLSVRAPVGRLNITKKKIAIGRGLAAITAKNRCQNFLFYMLKEYFFKDNVIGNGSIFASITKDELLEQKFLIPHERLLSKFNMYAQSLDEKISVLSDNLSLLQEARDNLLPRLIKN